MYKESKLANGLIRLVSVLAVLIFLFGELYIMADTFPKDEYIFYGIGGYNSVIPAQPLDIGNFIIYNVIWMGATFIVWLLVVFIINGFRTKVSHIDKT